MLSDILSLDEVTLEPPGSRVDSIAGVRSRISELQEGDDTRSKHRAIVQALIDGHKPYDQELMDEAGRGDDANINFREAEGDVAAATTPYYELAFGVPRAANIEVYWGDNKQKCYEWSEAISNRYSETLWGWKGYKINLQLSHYQMVVFGRGPIMWDTKKGWHFKAKRDDSVWVADNAYCDLDTLEEMAIPGHFDPVQLYRKISTEVSSDDGWNIEMAKRAIIAASPATLKDNYHDAWVHYEASLRRGDCLWQNKAARIYYKDYLIKEFTGKITHCIVLDSTPTRDNPGSNNNTVSEDEDDFVFKKIGRFESFYEIINPFFFDVGPDGQWYSVKGLGPKIFDFRDLSNRFMCTLINGAAASCGIGLQATSGQAMQKIQETPMVRASGFNFIPPDWKVQDLQMRSAMEGPLGVKQLIDTVLSTNIGQYRQNDEETPKPTLGQEQLSITSETTLTRGAYDRYYHYADDLHEELARRMFDPDISEKDSGGKESLEMRRKLIEEDQVPEEALKFENFCSIKAVRNVGYGSPQHQMVVGDKMLQLMGTFDEEGRQHTKRMVVGNMVGMSQVDRFVKKFEDLGIPNDQEAWATVENNILRMPRAELKVTPAQNPTIHFTTHFQDALQHVQEMSQGQGNPMELFTHLFNVGQHNHKHLIAMQGDPTKKEELKRFTKMQMMLGKITDQLKKQLDKAKGKQAPKPQIDPKMIEGLLKLQGELKLKEMKLVSDESRKDRKLEAETQRKDKQTAAEIMRRNAETFQSAA